MSSPARSPSRSPAHAAATEFWNARAAFQRNPSTVIVPLPADNDITGADPIDYNAAPRTGSVDPYADTDDRTSPMRESTPPLPSGEGHLTLASPVHSVGETESINSDDPPYYEMVVGHSITDVITHRKRMSDGTYIYYGYPTFAHPVPTCKAPHDYLGFSIHDDLHAWILSDDPQDRNRLQTALQREGDTGLTADVFRYHKLFVDGRELRKEIDHLRRKLDIYEDRRTDVIKRLDRADAERRINVQMLEMERERQAYQEEQRRTMSHRRVEIPERLRGGCPSEAASTTGDPEPSTSTTTSPPPRPIKKPRIDNTSTPTRGHQQLARRTGGRPRPTKRCYACGQPGHIRKDCPRHRRSPSPNNTWDYDDDVHNLADDPYWGEY